MGGAFVGRGIGNADGGPGSMIANAARAVDSLDTVTPSHMLYENRMSYCERVQPCDSGPYLDHPIHPVSPARANVKL